MQPSLPQILAHESFVRSLARQLAHDEHAADDLVQETWRVAVERPPREAQNLRGWLRRVLENLAYRAARRRAALRETAIADEVQETARQCAERAERVGHEVLKLREPYRSVVLMRFYDGDSPARIAKRLDRPLNTVNSQLNRALRLLERRLAPEGDSHAAVLWACWSVLRRSIRRVPGPLRWLLPTIALGAIAWQAAPEESSASLQPPVLAAARTTDTGDVGVSSVSGRRTARFSNARVTTRRIGVIVTDEFDRPIPNAEVFVGAAQWSTDGTPGGAIPRAHTGSDGKTSLAFEPTDRIDDESLSDEPVLAVHVLAPGYSPSRLAYVTATAESKALAFELSPSRRSLAGRVLDPNGEPVPGALVELGNADLRVQTTQPGRFHRERLWQTLTDEDGRFGFEHLDRTSALVIVRAPGFPMRSASVRLTDEKPVQRDIVLKHGRVLAGKLTTEFGEPIVGATVAVDSPSSLPITTLSDEDGRFELDGLPAGTVHAQAFSVEGELAADERLTLPASGTTNWSPQLARTYTFRLRPNLATGESFDAPVLLTARSNDGCWAGQPQSIRDGVYEFVGVPSPRASLAVYASQRAVLRGQGPIAALDVEPTLEPLSVPVSLDQPARLIGTIVTAEGDVAAGMTLILAAGPRGEHASQWSVDSTTGEFDVGPVTARTYELAIWTRAGYAELGRFTPEPGSTTDCGVVRLPAPVPVPWDVVADDACRHSIHGHAPAYLPLVGDDFVPLTRGAGAPAPRALLPGTYRVTLNCPGQPQDVRLVDVRPQ